MLERDVKLAVSPAFHLPPLADTIPGAVAGPEAESRLESVYFDTVDLRLARWGCSLRHRSGGSQQRPGEWTLQLPAGRTGGLERTELTYPGPARRPPDEAERLVRAFVRRAPLQAMARLSTWRRQVALLDESGRLLATIVDDEVSILQGRRVAARFRELEIDLGDGAGETGLTVLDPLLMRLQEAGDGLTDGTPKHVRALGPIASVPEVAIPSLPERPTAGEVVTSALAMAVVTLLRHDPGVRLSRDPEDVHQARVSLRRIRSNLRSFGTLLDPPWTAALRSEAGWLAAELGAVRDREVLLERVESEVAGLEPPDQRVAGSLTQRLEAELAAARSELLAAVDSDRYLDLVEALVDAARQPRLTGDAANPAVEILPALVRRPWRQLRRAVDALPGDPENAQLHRLRILAKRVRYAAEAAAPVGGEPAAKFARRAAALQTVLGEHQDSVVAREWIRGAAGSGRRAFVAGLLYGLEQAHGTDARARWRGAWDRLAGRELRAWMR
ncbi:MAG: CYTH and CHAD domain-containing protein [Candidatus Dormiibacterota bacterium]